MSVLDEIVAQTRVDLEARRARVPMDALVERAVRSTRDFAGALKGPELSLIAELKPRSPSKGSIRPGARPRDIATFYEPFASAVSVLCDVPFFGGGYDLLAEMRALTDRPLLAKDFVVDAYQVYEARVHGADSVLLMASVLPEREVHRLLELARSLGMEPLVETHDDAELQIALRAGAKVIGVNSRDLRTLRIDLEQAKARLARVPDSCVRVAESGLSCRDDVEAIRGLADAALIGSALMSAPNPAARIEELGFRPHRNRLKVKICGIRDERGARACADENVDWAGFNFVPSSRRFIDPEGASALVSVVGPERSVGVFRDQSMGEVLRAARLSGVAWVQLHGGEPPSMCNALHDRGLRVIKALSVDGHTSHSDIEAFDEVADMRLFDAAVPGSGQAFDHEVLTRLKPRRPFLLAGGLNPDNVAEAARTVMPDGVDAASGVEHDGNVDPSRVALFCRAARGAKL